MLTSLCSAGHASAQASPATTPTATAGPGDKATQAANDILKYVNKFIADISLAAIPYLTAMAAIGVLTMALLQALKNMLPILRWYQRWRIERWLKKRAGAAPNVTAPQGQGDGTQFNQRPDCKKAQNSLIRLATDGDADAFFELQIEQLCGQMNAAVQVLLDDPNSDADLMRCLAAQCRPEDLWWMFNRPATPAAGAANAVAQSYQNYVDARGRVAHQVQRSIDAVQIAIGSDWKCALQAAAFIISFAVAFVGIWWESGGASTRRMLATGSITGLFAGFLAPVARDLVAALESLRKP